MNLRPTMAGSRGAAAPAADVRSLAEQLGARVHIDVTIPRTSVQAKMRLCTRSEEFEAKVEARAFLTEHGYSIGADGAGSFAAAQEWSLELATRMVQRAVRDPANPSLELAKLEDWRQCDDQQILALWSQYNDLAVRLDPMGANALTEDQVNELTTAAKKKDADLLMLFGSRLLALFAITSVSPPAMSATPTSSPGA